MDDVTEPAPEPIEAKDPGVPACEFPDGDELDSAVIVDDGAPDDDL